MDINIENKYIKIKLMNKFPKTNVYDVINISGKYVLGQIKWYSPWRKYCFFPSQDFKLIFDDKCLTFIIEFMKKITNEYKAKKTTNISK